VTVAVLANGAVGAMAVTAGSAELTLLFVFDVFVLLARTGGTVAEGGGVAVTALTHGYSPSFENIPLL
jgi:hypothetical protein